MSAPSDVDALAALRVVAAWLGLGAASLPAIYDQTQLPPGVTRDAFLRLHRARTKERAPGWSRRGKARLVTAEAWSAEIARDTSRAVPRRLKNVFQPPPKNLDHDLDRRLGIRTRAG